MKPEAARRVLVDVRAVWIVAVALAGCGEPPRVVAPSPVGSGSATAAHAPDPDLEPLPVRRLLTIDWPKVKLTNDAEALALWDKIAPTGADWDDKLEEVPTNLPVARGLAVALLRQGNFACGASVSTSNCTRILELSPLAKTATLTDPCLRRSLALWAIDQLDPADVAGMLDPLTAIASLPPPESQLVVAALRAIPEVDQDTRVKLLLAAWQAGQREVVNTNLSGLDEAHLKDLATTHHVEGALEILSADGHKDTYLRAVTDDKLASKARVQAIAELVSAGNTLAPDVKGTLVTATRAADCTVAAMAARKLEMFGDKRFVPTRPHTSSTAAMMRSLCVLASYEQLQQPGEDSALKSYVPPRGLERVEVTYDPLSDTDSDGDGDPHTARKADLVPRGEVTLPDLDDLVRAMSSCKGAVCSTETREFRFQLKPMGGELMLTRIEDVELPPCQDKPAQPGP